MNFPNPAELLLLVNYGDDSVSKTEPVFRAVLLICRTFSQQYLLLNSEPLRFDVVHLNQKRFSMKASTVYFF